MNNLTRFFINLYLRLRGFRNVLIISDDQLWIEKMSAIFKDISQIEIKVISGDYHFALRQELYQNPSLVLLDAKFEKWVHVARMTKDYNPRLLLFLFRTCEETINLYTLKDLWQKVEVFFGEVKLSKLVNSQFLSRCFHA